MEKNLLLENKPYPQDLPQIADQETSQEKLCPMLLTPDIPNIQTKESEFKSRQFPNNNTQTVLSSTPENSPTTPLEEITQERRLSTNKPKRETFKEKKERIQKLKAEKSAKRIEVLSHKNPSSKRQSIIGIGISEKLIKAIEDGQNLVEKRHSSKLDQKYLKDPSQKEQAIIQMNVNDKNSPYYLEDEDDDDIYNNYTRNLMLFNERFPMLDPNTMEVITTKGYNHSQSHFIEEEEEKTLRRTTIDNCPSIFEKSINIDSDKPINRRNSTPSVQPIFNKEKSSQQKQRVNREEVEILQEEKNEQMDWNREKLKIAKKRKSNILNATTRAFQGNVVGVRRWEAEIDSDGTSDDLYESGEEIQLQEVDCHKARRPSSFEEQISYEESEEIEDKKMFDLVGEDHKPWGAMVQEPIEPEHEIYEEQEPLNPEQVTDEEEEEINEEDDSSEYEPVQLDNDLFTMSENMDISKNFDIEQKVLSPDSNRMFMITVITVLAFFIKLFFFMK